MPLTFVVGQPAEVFDPAFAAKVEAELRQRFSEPGASTEEAYRSDDVDVAGWRALQKRIAAVLGKNSAPHLTAMDAYQAVYIPRPRPDIEHVMIPPAADPLQIGSLDELLRELREFASAAQLPTDDVELMALAARYLEDDAAIHSDLDVQTFIQLLLSAKQAAVRRQPLWVST